MENRGTIIHCVVLGSVPEKSGNQNLPADVILKPTNSSPSSRDEDVREILFYFFLKGVQSRRDHWTLT